ncbi:hypothetical protein B0H17DRAFT_1014731 [Mycena rosella]|uniref:5-hmdU DNA kinase helical domain-containing protein n=1 Tax=Mycena rosella TaxID=1033263 RepID=A0AAD7D6Y3_MYCRO|nr:hypothetical protein B0H17DRAFT_1014731 [Mycena rosella]
MPADRSRGARRGGSTASVHSDAVTSSAASQSTRRSSRLFSDAFTPESDLSSVPTTPEPETPATIVIQGQTLEPTVVFDTLWRWLTERKAIDDKRRAGMPQPWTTDKILQTYKFCNAYRVLDRTSQFVVRDVIEQGSQDRTELLFRILLFNCFNRIETWTLLKDAFGGELTYAAFDLAAYDRVLDAALNDQSLFTGAYIKIGKPLDYSTNHMHYLQQLQILMRDLPPILENATYVADVYEQIAAYPGMGAFLAYQLLLSLLYSPLLPFSANDFVVPGPGASSGLTKMFGRSLRAAREAVPDIETHILHWLVATQHTHFARLGLAFAFLRDAAGAARALDAADLEHAVCEVDKYARNAHPSVRGIGNRRGMRGVFHASPSALPAVPTLPRAWADPARRQARVRPTPVDVEKRWVIVEVLGERATPPQRRVVHSDAIEYKVSWLRDISTWEPRYAILDDAPELVEEYEARKGAKGAPRCEPELVEDAKASKGKKGKKGKKGRR